MNEIERKQVQLSFCREQLHT